jgi:allantoin racemase
MYQSFGPPDNTRYLSSLVKSIDTMAGLLNLDVVVTAIPDTKFVTKQVRAFHPGAISQLLESVYRADQEDFDAVIVGNIQDPGLYEARQIARAPVVGLLEAALLGSRPFGTSISLVTSSPLSVPLLRERIRVYGLDVFVTEIRATDAGLSGWADGFADVRQRGLVASRFSDAVRAAAEAGADLVIPASGLVATLLSEEWGVRAGWVVESGVPVVNPVFCALQAAATAANSYRAGMEVSRVGAFYRPDTQSLAEHFGGSGRLTVVNVSP